MGTPSLINGTSEQVKLDGTELWQGEGMGKQKQIVMHANRSRSCQPSPSFQRLKFLILFSVYRATALLMSGSLSPEICVSFPCQLVDRLSCVMEPRPSLAANISRQFSPALRNAM